MEPDVNIIQVNSFGDAAMVYYKLGNGLTMADMFRKIYESGGSIGRVTLIEDTDRDMKSIEGTYEIQDFLSNVEYFIDTLKQGGDNSSISLSASMSDEPCVITAYPKKDFIEFKANIKEKDGKKVIPISLKNFVEKKNQTLGM